MFKDNKYLKWYYQLCGRNYLGKDKHRHHIIPKSLGGSDDPSNLVDLSYRQHFVAHRLLLKITEGTDRSKMAFAMMRFGKTSRFYEAVSKQISEALSGEGNPMYGRKLTEEHRAKISGEKHGMFGRGCYDVWIENYGIDVANKLKEEMFLKRSLSLSGEGNPMYGTKRTEEQKLAQSVRMTGNKHPMYGKQRHPTKWMNNGETSLMVKIEFVQEYLDHQWILGRLPKKIKVTT